MTKLLFVLHGVQCPCFGSLGFSVKIAVAPVLGLGSPGLWARAPDWKV